MPAPGAGLTPRLVQRVVDTGLVLLILKSSASQICRKTRNFQ